MRDKRIALVVQACYSGMQETLGLAKAHVILSNVRFRLEAFRLLV